MKSVDDDDEDDDDDGNEAPCVPGPASDDSLFSIIIPSVESLTSMLLAALSVLDCLNACRKLNPSASVDTEKFKWLTIRVAPQISAITRRISLQNPLLQHRFVVDKLGAQSAQSTPFSTSR
jgi:hypothetical protein